MGQVPAPDRRSGERRPVVGGASGFARSVPRGAQIDLCARRWRNVRVWTAVSDARLLLTCGLPAAGKTTLARQLAADRRALRLTQDEWLIALGSSPWDASTRERVDHELWRLAQEVLRLGLSVVVDFGLWARIERDEMRSVARGLGVGVELHYLDVPAAELWRRIEARNLEPPWNCYPIARADFDEWLRIFQAPDAAELALFDPPPEPN